MEEVKVSFKDIVVNVALIINKRIIDEIEEDEYVKHIETYIRETDNLYIYNMTNQDLTSFFDKSGVKPEDNYAILLPLILGIFSLFSFLLDYIFKMLRSDIYESKKVYSNYEKIIYKLMLDKASKKRQEKKNSDNKN